MDEPTYGSGLLTKEKCVGHRKNGKRCKRWPVNGATVCAVHGGSAPQVRKKAQERIAMAADEAASYLIRWMRDESFPAAERRRCAVELLQAVKLLGPSVELDVDATWHVIIQDVIGDVDDGEARELPARYQDVVEGEVVPPALSASPPDPEPEGSEIHVVEGGTVYDMNTRSRVRRTRRSPTTDA